MLQLRSATKRKKGKKNAQKRIKYPLLKQKRMCQALSINNKKYYGLKARKKPPKRKKLSVQDKKSLNRVRPPTEMVRLEIQAVSHRRQLKKGKPKKKKITLKNPIIHGLKNSMEQSREI